MRLVEVVSLAVVMSVMAAGGCAGNAKPGHGPISTAEMPYPAGKKFLVNVDDRGVAVMGGYDPVAFFTDGKPVKGDARFSSVHEGATYCFASAEHKRTFDADPHKYIPQFGGFCAYAASINKVSPIDVKYWEIVDGRLLLQHNQKAWDLWHKTPRESLTSADKNWPGLVENNGL